MQIYDVVFVGSGLSSSATLYQILSGLEINGTSQKKIAVIEKNNEFFKGIPYGNRSSINSLTINPIKDFFLDEEKPIFFSWLKDLRANYYLGFDETEKSVLEMWTVKNSESLNQSDFDGLYIPRFLYGAYLSDKLNTVVAKCAAKNLATVELICGEATDATTMSNGAGYTIAIQTQGETMAIAADILILATGSLEAKPINKEPQQVHLCVNDIYTPSLEVTIKKLCQSLLSVDPEKRNILVIGANASASEIIHMLRKGLDQQPDLFKKISILATSGLPDRLYVNSDYDYLLENLTRLDGEGNYTAHQLMHAIELDVKNAAEKQQLSVGKIHYSLSDKVVKMQKSLSPAEAINFFNNYGWSFTRITRRTSEDYFITGQELAATGKLDFIRGRFVRLCDRQNDETGLTFIYTAQGQSTEVVYKDAFPVIINCAGAETIATTSSTLIKNLLIKGLCKINHNGMGVAVDEEFSAGDNLYVIGPLMAGIYNSKFKFWHLENAKRLNFFGSILAGTIVKKMKVGM